MKALKEEILDYVASVIGKRPRSIQSYYLSFSGNGGTTNGFTLAKQDGVVFVGRVLCCLDRKYQYQRSITLSFGQAVLGNSSIVANFSAAQDGTVASDDTKIVNVELMVFDSITTTVQGENAMAGLDSLNFVGYQVVL